MQSLRRHFGLSTLCSVQANPLDPFFLTHTLVLYHLWDFLLWSLCSHILFPKIIYLFPPLVGISSCILHLLAGRICLRCFKMAYFIWIVCSCLSIFLDFLLSLVPSDLFPWVVSFFTFFSCVYFFFWSQHILAFFIWLSIVASLSLFTAWGFFMSASTDGLSQEFEE